MGHQSSSEGGLNYVSVCSGIEAASVAWKPLGWHPLAYSEIQPFPSEVLAYRHGDTPNLGDMTRYQEWPAFARPTDVLVGGTPCQSYSVAGLRAGLDDPRGDLMLTFGAVARHLCARWLVWENVPGVLSSNGGRDFGTFLGALVQLGYGFAYRVLDAQYFGLAQRRERVFVVACLGDWRSAAAVLSERSSLSGHPAPSREAGARVAASLTRGAESGGRGGPAGRRQEDDFNIVGSLAGTSPGGGWRFGPDEAAAGHLISHALNKNGRYDSNGETFVAHSLRGSGFDASEDGTGRGTPLVFQARASACNSMNPAEFSPTLDKGKAEGMSALIGSSVRRLTPRECERLQGFPDDYTLIPRGKRGKPAQDGPRYAALGNSMAVPVMAWIGRRIAAVERIMVEAHRAA